MNIEKITKFIQEEAGRKFFKKIQLKELNSVNQIQKLIEQNPDKPVRDLLSQFRIQKDICWKIPDSFDLIFTRKGAEQCSSSLIADYNASKFMKFHTVADLCCGIGMDLMSIASNKDRVFAVDSDRNTLMAAEYNCQRRNLSNVEFLNEKAENFNREVEAVFIDPDRRKNGKRQIKAENYSPSFSSILAMSKRFPHLAAKLSPLFDYDDLKIDPGYTLEFVSERGTLKELLLCLGKTHTESVTRKAVLLPSGSTIDDREKVHREFSTIKKYIYEPDPAIIRAGLVAELAEKIDYKLIDARSAILTSDKITTENFGRIYQVVQIMPYNLRRLTAFIQENDIGELVLKTRGFSETVEEMRKKLKLKGKKSAIIFIIKLQNKHKMLLLRSLNTHTV